jgi:ribosome biogenesis GTPase A
MNIKALTSPWYVMMVGMPATGKTTFINNMKHPSSY